VLVVPRIQLPPLLLTRLLLLLVLPSLLWPWSLLLLPLLLLVSLWPLWLLLLHLVLILLTPRGAVQQRQQA
jgi:hypothetical protein